MERQSRMITMLGTGDHHHQEFVITIIRND
jgi:hypothetical protein